MTQHINTVLWPDCRQWQLYVLQYRIAIFTLSPENFQRPSINGVCNIKIVKFIVAALHQGTPGQMTWLEDPPPWLRPAYCFALVIVWTENKNVTIYDCFISFIVTVKRCWQPVFWGRQLIKIVNFFEEKVHPADLARGFSDLEITRLLYSTGAATGNLLILSCSWMFLSAFNLTRSFASGNCYLLNTYVLTKIFIK